MQRICGANEGNWHTWADNNLSIFLSQKEIVSVTPTRVKTPLIVLKSAIRSYSVKSSAPAPGQQKRAHFTTTLDICFEPKTRKFEIDFTD